MSRAGDTRNALRVALAACVLTAALAGAALNSSSARGDASSLYAGMEAGDFSEFSQVGESAGELQITSERTAAGAYAAKASYRGGGNGYARGQWEVGWRPGETVSYGASFYLPKGFHAAMQGQVSLMRWDNWGIAPQNTDRGGIAIFGSDRKAYLVRTRDGVEQAPLVGPFKLPEGRWFELVVVQRLGTADAFSRVYLDGELIGASQEKNSYGRAVDRIRYGIVAIDAERQRNSLELYFDEAWAGPGQWKPPAPEFPSQPQPPKPSGDAPKPKRDRKPKVKLVKPARGAKVKPKGKLKVRANAADDRGVKVVKFRVDGKLRKSVRKAPYVWQWKQAGKQLSPGKHTIRAIAVDTAGQKARAEVEIKRLRK